MASINPAAAAAREAARAANGEFGEQHHSAPTSSLSQPIDQVHFEAPVKLAGFVPDDIGSTLAEGFSWAHSRGTDLEPLQQVRRAAGAISDEDFKRLYERYTEYTGGRDDYSTFDWESWNTRQKQPTGAAAATFQTTTFPTPVSHPKATWAGSRSKGTSHATPKRRV